MAYTIISQNNSTTTLSDGVNTITVPSRVNLTSGNFTIVEVNNNMATLEDGDGNVYRDIPCVATLVDAGGGGGAVSSVNGKTGAVVLNATDVDAIPQYSTMPTADSSMLGEIAQFIGTTNANYTNGYFYKCVSDGQTPATYSWEQTDVQPAGSSLPDQTGQSGKFLTTDGTDASWGNALVNKNTSMYGIRISNLSSVTNVPSVSVGGSAEAISNYSTAIGPQAIIQSNSAHAVVVGNGTVGTNAPHAKQIGPGTNNDANTMKVGNANGNFELMSADGTIPTARFTTDPSADGTYYPTLTISSGTPTRSWSTIAALQNTATGTDSLTISGTPNTNKTSSLNIGPNSSVLGDYATCVGTQAVSYHNGVAYGARSNAAATWAVAIGAYALASASYAIQLGGNKSNSDANTFKVANANGNYEMMSANGTIPTARLTKVNTTVTLTAAGWSSNTQTVTVTGMTATGVVLVSPDPTDQSAYTSAGVYCTAQAANSLTFTCSTTPTADIDVNVVML